MYSCIANPVTLRHAYVSERDSVERISTSLPAQAQGLSLPRGRLPGDCPIGRIRFRIPEYRGFDERPDGRRFGIRCGDGVGRRGEGALHVHLPPSSQGQSGTFSEISIQAGLCSPVSIGPSGSSEEEASEELRAGENSVGCGVQNSSDFIGRTDTLGSSSTKDSTVEPPTPTANRQPTILATSSSLSPLLEKRQVRNRNLRNRIIFGTVIGLSAGFAVLAGGLYFSAGMALIGCQGTWEYFGLVEAKSKLRKEAPLPAVTVYACCAMCFAMPLITQKQWQSGVRAVILAAGYYGSRIGWALASASALLLSTLLLHPNPPTRPQCTNLLFGLLYCGYLPSFWIKLRCGLSAALPLPPPLLPLLWLRLGGVNWSVGLVATFVAFAAIIAADTGAYIGGKMYGKTKLIDISPKKTCEGAAAGLASALTVTVGLSRLLGWPGSVASAATLGLLVFLASLFGDLAESMLKRDAGVKDSGHLIPGHGGILDRVDSYIFTGAVVYSFVKVGLPLFGF